MEGRQCTHDVMCGHRRTDLGALGVRSDQRKVLIQRYHQKRSQFQTFQRFQSFQKSALSLSKEPALSLSKVQALRSLDSEARSRRSTAALRSSRSNRLGTKTEAQEVRQFGNSRNS
jgi:hypothetical protein